MPATAIITIVASSCALIINLLLLIGTILGGNLDQKLHRYFFATIFFSLIPCACEITTDFLVGMPGETVARVFRLVDFMNYACAGLTIIAFSFYLHQYLSMKREILRTPFTVINILSVVHILLMSVELFYPLFGYLNENNVYFATDLIWLTLVIPALAMVLFSVIVLRSAKVLEKRECFSLLLYVLFPLICYGIELLVPGVWVVSLGGAISLFFIYANIQVDLRHKLLEKEMELTESRIAIEISQIQPHFLYNSLSAIENLCDVDVEKAKAAINDFAHYLRGNLASLGQRKLICFEDELEHVQTYVGLEKLRFGERLKVVYHVETEDFQLPPLTVQPIVENAIRHGITKKKDGGTVTVSVREQADAICILVEDDGVGFDPGKRKQDGREHIGIDNVRARLASLCNGKLEICSSPGVGTTATITMPKQEGGHL